MNRKAQRHFVLCWLLSGASLTQMEATEERRILRLAAIIFNLRKMGVDIETHKVKNQGHGIHARYRIPADSLQAMREMFLTK